MKKRYIYPEVTIVHVKMHEILNGSPMVKLAQEKEATSKTEDPDETDSDVLSRKSKWDYDDNYDE